MRDTWASVDANKRACLRGKRTMDLVPGFAVFVGGRDGEGDFTLGYLRNWSCGHCSVKIERRVGTIGETEKHREEP